MSHIERVIFNGLPASGDRIEGDYEKAPEGHYIVELDEASGIESVAAITIEPGLANFIKDTRGLPHNLVITGYDLFSVHGFFAITATPLESSKPTLQAAIRVATLWTRLDESIDDPLEPPPEVVCSRFLRDALKSAFDLEFDFWRQVGPAFIRMADSCLIGYQYSQENGAERPAEFRTASNKSGINLH